MHHVTHITSRNAQPLLGDPDMTAAFDVATQFRNLDPMECLVHAKVIASKLGVIQDEATIRRTPILALRDTAMRQETAAFGTDDVVSHDPAAVLARLEGSYTELPWTKNSPITDNSLGTGDAGDKIAHCIEGLACGFYDAIEGRRCTA
jgi:UDP-N-acetylglucosamine 2-epimerase